MSTYSLPINISITDEEISDIVDAAINYCGYWCDQVEYGNVPNGGNAMSQALMYGGTLVFHIDEPFEEGGKTKFELTTIEMLKAIANYGSYDFYQFDGPMSDEVLQTALFGEVVYG